MKPFRDFLRASGGNRRFLLALALMPFASRARSAEIRVPADFSEIQEALDAAADGDTVLVEPGEYLIREPLDFNRLHDPLDPASPRLKNLTLRAAVAASADPLARDSLIDETILRMYFRPKNPLRASVIIFENGERFASVLEGFTVTGGQGSEIIPGSGVVGGGGILCRNGAQPTIIRCRITGNRADGPSAAGGGICCQGASPRFKECSISRNSAGRGGGFFCSDSGASPVLKDCEVADNRAAGIGGGLLSEGLAAPVLDGCRITGNAAGYQGGGLAGGDGMVVIGCRIEGNSAPEGGGATASGTVFLRLCRIAANQGGGMICQAESRVTVEECAIEENNGGGIRCYQRSAPVIDRTVISGNRGAAGAGVSLMTPYAVLTGCRILENIASYRAGGVLIGASPPRLIDCEIRRNFAEIYGGGAVFEFGSSAELTGCRIAENGAGRRGGGLVAVAAAPRLIDCEIAANAAGLSGGGAIFELGSGGVLEGCSITGNASLLQGSLGAESEWGGGGILCDTGSSPLLDRCVLSGNRSHLGGALSASENSSPRLISCLITGNLAEFWGGGVLAFASSPRLTQCTLVGNRAEQGGGIHCSYAIPVLESSIVWGNEPPGACGHLDRTLSGTDPRFVRPGTFDFDRFKLLELAGRSFAAPDFIIDPGDYRLESDSPAIDAGLPASAPDRDIAGQPRSCAAAPDLGAHERCDAAASRFRRGDATGDGLVDMADAVDILARLFSGAGPPACAASADADDSGAIDLTDPVYLLSHQFLGGPEPPEPFTACGTDPTADGLNCEYSQKCD